MGRHMGNIQKETHVVSVMTDWYKETCTVVRDEKDDRLLPHQIRRPRLTEGGGKSLKNIRQQRGKLFRQGTTFHAVTKIVKTPSCKLWHPPVCQDYKSGTGCKYGRTCFFRHVESEEKPSKKSKKGGAKGSVALLKESTPLVCVEGKLGSKHAVNFSKSTWHQIRKELSNSGEPHERSPCAPKFGKGHMEEILHQERCALGEHIFKLKSAENASFLLLLNKGNAGTHFEKISETTIRSRFRSIIAHDEQKKNQAQMNWILREDPGTHCGAYRKWRSAYKRGSTSFRSRSKSVREVQLLEETRAVVSLGKLCEDHGYSHEWVTGQKNTVDQRR